MAERTTDEPNHATLRRNYRTLRDTIVNAGVLERWATQEVCILIHGDDKELAPEDAFKSWVSTNRNDTFTRCYEDGINPYDLYTKIEEQHA